MRSLSISISLALLVLTSVSSLVIAYFNVAIEAAGAVPISSAAFTFQVGGGDDDSRSIFLYEGEYLNVAVLSREAKFDLAFFDEDYNPVMPNYLDFERQRAGIYVESDGVYTISLENKSGTSADYAVKISW